MEALLPNHFVLCTIFYALFSFGFQLLRSFNSMFQRFRFRFLPPSAAPKSKNAWSFWVVSVGFFFLGGGQRSDWFWNNGEQKNAPVCANTDGEGGWKWWKANPPTRFCFKNNETPNQPLRWQTNIFFLQLLEEVTLKYKKNNAHSGLLLGPCLLTSARRFFHPCRHLFTDSHILPVRMVAFSSKKKGTKQKQK